MTRSMISGSGRGDFHILNHGRAVDELIIQYMEENNIPGMSLSIVQAPYITSVVGYGYADLQTKRLVATNSLFYLGQITNAYTAVAIMQLKEANKLNLDDRISAHLDDLPATWGSITIHNLMTHSSGLPSYTDNADFDYSRDYSAAELLALIKSEDLAFEPGTKMNSSDTNSYLLGLIIEKASGMSFQAYVTKNQIERLGLKNTFFVTNQQEIANEVNNGSSPFKHSQFLQNPVYINPTEVATGYSEGKAKLEPVKIPTWSSTYASAGVIASAQDLSLWDIGLAGGILVKDPKNREYLYNPVLLEKNKRIPGNVGWFFPGHPGLLEIKGNIPGFSAFLSRFTEPKELLCVTLLANKDNLPDLDVLARKIAGAFDQKLAAPTGSSWSETLQSPYSVDETLDRVAKIINAQGGTIFARVDHSGAAAEVGLNLESTQVLIIGNPAKGTALMQANSAIALDLPLRIMATSDNTGQVWLSFVEPVELAREYGLSKELKPLLKQMSTGLHKLCQKAISAKTI